MEPSKEQVERWRFRMESIARDLDAVKRQLAYVLDRMTILAGEINDERA